MKKRLLPTLLALSLVLGLLPGAVWAAGNESEPEISKESLERLLPSPGSGIIDSGTLTGYGIQWTLFANYTLSISWNGKDGDGQMPDYRYYDTWPWYQYRKSITKVVLGEGISRLDSGAFHECAAASIYLPSTLTRVGAYQSLREEYNPFYSCPNLEEIIVDSNNSVYTSIDGVLFTKDRSMLASYPRGRSGSYSIPGGVTLIGAGSFRGCDNLTDITIPDSTTAIERHAVSGCSNLSKIVIPDSVASIGTYAFSECAGAADISISNRLTELKDGVFWGCESVKSLLIPGNITSIHVQAIRQCTSLQSVFIPKSVTSFAAYGDMFCDCPELTDIYYGGSREDWLAIENAAKNTSEDGNLYIIKYYNQYGYDERTKTATIHYNSAGETPAPKPQEYHVYCNGGSEKFPVSLEDWVKENSSKYHPELAHMLMAMSSSVKSETDIRKTFESFGFAPGDIRTDYRLSEILEAYGMAKKQIGNQTLVVIALRGTDAGMEIVDDLTGYLPPALTGQQSGFRSAALILYDKMTSSDFLGTTDFSNTKFVLTGFSRGAGVANLLAARLIDDGVAEKNVYAYTFACPDSAIVDDNTAGRYRTIFNISNINDFVSWSPSGWLTGYGKWFKYGQSYWFAHDWSDYQNLEMALDFDNIHNEGKYLEYLRNNNDKSITDYKTRREAKKVLDFAVKWRNEKFWNDVQNNFLSFVGIRCPVDVEIYDSDQLVGSITNNLAQVNDAGKIYISVLNDEKDIYLLTDGEYTFKLTAAGEGTMEYMIQNIDVKTRTAIAGQSFKDVMLTPGKAFTSAVTVAGNTAAGVKEQEIKLYVLDTAGEPAKEVDSSGTETPITPPPPPEHTHVWETAWRCDETHHWKECSTSECPITENSSKSEYGEHTYDKENETVCSTCEYKRALNPPRPAVEEETYYISILGIMNGEIILNTRYASPGERVTLTAHPGKGYKLDTITVTDIRGRTLALRELSGNSYSFTMPDNRVTVKASFSGIEDNTSSTSTPAEDEPFTGLGTPGISGIVLNPAIMPFTDVRAGDWFYDSVDYVWKHYLMSGVSGIEFSPNTTTSRAMIWTVLARMNNIRTEVNPGSNWYERGMLWAMEQGITDGSNPMGDITREQLAAMLWRNAGSPSAAADLSQFSDNNTVSGYALGAVNWAVVNGILNGSDGKLNPKGTATRAQVAAMVMRYGERVGA